MASFTGITAAAADAILAKTVTGANINQSGHLILTRSNGEVIDAGDFTAIVTGILGQQVTDKLATELPKAVAGKYVDKGNFAGALKFTEFDNNNIVNALIKVTMTGNVTIAVGDLPANPKPNTQFVIKFVQAGSANGTNTLLLTGIKKSFGSLDLTAAANAVDYIVFVYDGEQWIAGAMALAVA